MDNTLHQLAYKQDLANMLPFWLLVLYATL